MTLAIDSVHTIAPFGGSGTQISGPTAAWSPRLPPGSVIAVNIRHKSTVTAVRIEDSGPTFTFALAFLHKATDGVTVSEWWWGVVPTDFNNYVRVRATLTAGSTGNFVAPIVVTPTRPMYTPSADPQPGWGWQNATAVAATSVDVAMDTAGPDGDQLTLIGLSAATGIGTVSVATTVSGDPASWTVPGAGLNQRGMVAYKIVHGASQESAHLNWSNPENVAASIITLRETPLVGPPIFLTAKGARGDLTVNRAVLSNAAVQNPTFMRARSVFLGPVRRAFMQNVNQGPFLKGHARGDLSVRKAAMTVVDMRVQMKGHARGDLSVRRATITSVSRAQFTAHAQGQLVVRRALMGLIDPVTLLKGHARGDSTVRRAVLSSIDPLVHMKGHARGDLSVRRAVLSSVDNRTTLQGHAQGSNVVKRAVMTPVLRVATLGLTPSADFIDIDGSDIIITPNLSRRRSWKAGDSQPQLQIKLDDDATRADNLAWTMDDVDQVVIDVFDAVTRDVVYGDAPMTVLDSMNRVVGIALPSTVTTLPATLFMHVKVHYRSPAGWRHFPNRSWLVLAIDDPFGVAPTPTTPPPVIVVPGPPGPPGPASIVPGPKGDKGDPGAPGTGANFTWTQSVAAATWHVVHNLGFVPSILTTDDSGNVIEGEPTVISVNETDVAFGSALTGRAYCS